MAYIGGIKKSKLRDGTYAMFGKYPDGINFTKFDIDEKDESSTSIISISNKFCSELIDYFMRFPHEMKTMDRRNFEELVAELYSGMGYDVELTQRTKDGGKDIIAIANFGETRNKYLIECKRPDPGNAVSVGVVRALMGVKYNEKATKAIAVTTTHFSSDAHAFKDNNIWELDLKEYDDLVKWLNDYKSTH